MALHPTSLYSPAIARCTARRRHAFFRRAVGFAWTAIIGAVLPGLAAAAQVALAWKDNSLNEVGFRIERSVNGGAFTTQATVGANVVAYVDSSVAPGTEYTYRVCAYNVSGDSEFSNSASNLLPPSRLVNLSIRAVAGSGSDTLIVGFVVAGPSGKTLLVRGIGPTLGAYGVSGPLDDPVLSLFAGSRLAGSNDDWGTAGNAAQIVLRSAALGAFPLAGGSRDAAMLAVLDRGVHSAVLDAKGGATGVALVELYDNDDIAEARLVNVSARTNVGSQSRAPAVGFVIKGTLATQVLVRAIGPTLANYGVTGVLGDPRLSLHQLGNATPIRENDNWGGTLLLINAFGYAGAFSLANGSRDAALLVTLEPGAYTATVTAVNDGTGVALLEVYEVR